MYAIVDIAGSQYKVEDGSRIEVPKLSAEPNSSLVFNSVLMVRDGDQCYIGSPYLNNVTVSATMVRVERQKKIVVYKYKRRKGYHRKQGHRQYVAIISIDRIEHKKEAE